jgi:excinuclease ABC subunit B
MGNPEDYKSSIIRIHTGLKISRNAFLTQLVDSLYARTETDFKRSTFRVRGDTVDIHLPYVDYGFRITFFGDEIEVIERIELETGKRIEKMQQAAYYGGN